MFTEINVSALKGGGGKGETVPKFRISKGGSMGLNRHLLSLMGENDSSTQYVHFLKNDEGHYYIYLDGNPKNGLKMRIQNKGGSRDGVIQCRGLVKQIIADLDLAVGDEAKSSVRLDVEPSLEKVPGTKAKAFRIY